VLRDLGFRVADVRSVAKATAAFEKTSYALVVALPTADDPHALRACEALRAGAASRPLLVVAATGADLAGVAEDLVARGADDVIERPLDRAYVRMRLVLAMARLAERAGEASTTETLRQFEKAFETMQLGVTICDAEGRIVYTNPAEAAMHGYAVEELLGVPGSHLAPPDLRRPVRPRDLTAMRRWQRESVNLRKDGTTFPAHLMSDVVSGSGGRPLGVITTCEDITARKEVEKALQESEERYALAARGANDGLWDWDLRVGVFYASQRWREIAGLPEDERLSPEESWLERVHPGDAPAVRAALEAHLTGRSPHFACEHRLRHTDGSYRWVLVRGCAVRNGSGEATRVAGSLTDITDRKLHDPATGLPNRTLALDRLEQALERVRRGGCPGFAVVSLELDRLGHVAQSYGAPIADALLARAAERLRAGLRGVDTVAAPETALAHMGGGRFTLLLQDLAEPRDAARVAARLQEVLRRPFAVDGREIFTTASVGIVTGTPGSASAEEVLRDADTAVAQARSSGGDAYVLFNQEMHTRAVASLELETALRRALERDEFTVVYQPIVSLQTGRVSGFEALVRWPRGDGRVLLPDDFIPVAEETGLIVPLDRAVIAKVCRQIRAWRPKLNGRKGLTVSVNVSGLQFTRPDFTLEIDRILRSVGVLGQALKLEITESVIMEHARYAAELLAELRRLDIKLSIDDFGTGYSSLSYLRRFEIDTLKVDKSFVSRMVSSSDSSEIVKAIISLGRNLGKDIVAEGLETRSQMHALRQLGCPQAQGFLFARPLEPDAAIDLVTRNSSAPFDLT